MAKKEKTPTMWTEELLRDYFYIMDVAYSDPNVDAEISADEDYTMEPAKEPKEQEEGDED